MLDGEAYMLDGEHSLLFGTHYSGFIDGTQYAKGRYHTS